MEVANTKAYYVMATITAIKILKYSPQIITAGNTKGGSITLPLTSDLTDLDYSILPIKTKIVNCYTADSKPVKQEVNGRVILPPLVFPYYKMV
jgi:hypothetical protein